MALVLGAVLIIGMIAACVGPLYYCKKSSQGSEHRDNDASEAESPMVHIKISHPRHAEFLTHEVCNDMQDSISYNEKKDTGQIIQEQLHLPEGISRIIPVKPPRKRRILHGEHSDSSDNCQSSKKSILKNTRSSASIWSSSLKNQLENIANSSSEACAVSKVVRAQVERCPTVSMSTNNETVNTFPNQSQHHKNINSVNLMSNERSSTKDNNKGTTKRTKLSSFVSRKWTNFKRMLTPARSKKSTLTRTTEDAEEQGSNHSVRLSCQRSASEHTTMLQKNRLVDASTSTRISSNIANPKDQINEDGIPSEDSCRSTETSTKGHQNIRTEISQDVASLIRRRSVNGKSLCDVKITGLSVSQSELVDLFEASGGRSHSASIVSTEEASIICIKFHRRRGANSKIHAQNNSSTDRPLRRFYNILPERFEDITLARLFRSQEQSDSDCSTSIKVPRSETSYVGLPKYGPRTGVKS